jgi:DNA-binding GntR family transcriptional regulator
VPRPAKVQSGLPSRRRRSAKTTGDDSEPIKRSADTVSRIYEQVHRMVIQFEIPPDKRINEVDLARRLSVSRTPLREALNRLATEGLLALEPNRGFRCRPLDTKDVFDLYEARAVVEIAAVRLACQRAEPEAVEALTGFWAEVSTMADRPAIELLGHDEAFHERLAALSGNAELVRALKSINARIHFVRWMDLEREDRRTTTYTEHGDLLEALRRRDEGRCVAVLSNHIARRLDEIVEIIKAGVVRLYLR